MGNDRHGMGVGGGVTDYYGQLQGRVDAFFADVLGRHAGRMQCRAGCSMCCHRHLSLFPVEADRVAEAVRALPEEVRERVRAQAVERPEVCPLLVDDRCSVYASRPIICRSHGVPIRWVEDDKPQVDVCPLNFTGGGTVPGDSVLDVDRLNEMLVAINAYHCKSTGAAPGTRKRIGDIVAEC